MKTNENSAKKCQVVMLSTNEKANALKGYKNRSLLFARKSSYHNEGELIERELAYFHLYITSDEEIKEGSYTRIKPNISILNEEYYYHNNEKVLGKIIATTDTSLTFKKHPKGVSMYLLPQPSPEFIAKYISEYNKGNIITDIMVEYEDEAYAGIRTNLGQPILHRDILKVDSHNQITIKPVQLKLYTEEEVINLLLNKHIEDFYPHPCPEGSDHEKNRNKISDWFNKSKENL